LDRHTDSIGHEAHMTGHALLAVAALLTVPLAAGGSAHAQQPQQPRCDAPEYRQFDFWIGEWEVTGQDGRVLGRNRITRILDGCVLLEEWIGAGGGTGKSMNAWDRTSGTWRQTWLDNGGGRLELSGGLQGAIMVLSNEAPGPDGAVVHQRLTFEPTDDGLRQHWQRSTDGGQTWTTLFDGQYHPEMKRER
jgi:hypothetical protein